MWYVWLMMLSLWSISANYSQPEIAWLHTRELKPNEYLNLSCSSSGGYPEPRQMTWLISHGNTTHSLMHHMDVSQDAVTKLYNVTSKLNITVPGNTLINISCLLHLGEQLGSLVSVPLVIGESPSACSDLCKGRSRAHCSRADHSSIVKAGYVLHPVHQQARPPNSLSFPGGKSYYSKERAQRRKTTATQFRTQPCSSSP